MEGGVRFSQILFATDYSETSGVAGRMAADLARRFNARLHVVHVVPPVTDPGPADALPNALAELGPGLDVVTAVIFGRPGREIVAYASRNGIDLIVMGTHGRTGVARALLGSVAAIVVRRAACAVLTVPGRMAEQRRIETLRTSRLRGPGRSAAMEDVFGPEGRDRR